MLASSHTSIPSLHTVMSSFVCVSLSDSRPTCMTSSLGSSVLQQRRHQTVVKPGLVTGNISQMEAERGRAAQAKSRSDMAENAVEKSTCSLVHYRQSGEDGDVRNRGWRGSLGGAGGRAADRVREGLHRGSGSWTPEDSVTASSRRWTRTSSHCQVTGRSRRCFTTK